MTSFLTERCDPYGIESTVKLFGGIYPDNMMGKYIWYCDRPAVSRHRFVCQGGDYGFRRQADGGLITAHHCDGGHKGLIMPLCKLHVRELAAGPPKPGFTADKKTAYGQVGGTVANEMCPKCAVPDEARSLMEHADNLQARMAQAQLMGVIGVYLRLQSEQDQVRAKLDELHERGIVHKCPLKLVEVS